MATISIRTRITGGHVVDETITETAPLLTVLQPVTALAAAITGALKTRLSATAGVISCATSGFGIASGAKVDVYWSGYGGLRYLMTASGVSGNCFSVADGLGANLPASGTTCQIGAVSVQPIAFDGDGSPFLCAQADRRANVVFRSGDQTVLKQKELIANNPWYWSQKSGDTRPISGSAVADICLSNGDAAGTVTVTVQVLHGNA
jgi:hypothetical protein